MGYCHISRVTDRYLDEVSDWEYWSESYATSWAFREDQERWHVEAAQYALIVDGFAPADLPTEDDYVDSYEYESAVERYREDRLCGDGW